MTTDILSDLTDSIMSDDFFGNMIETIYYTQSGGTEQEMSSHVFRPTPETVTSRGSRSGRSAIEIYVKRSDVDYVTVNEDSVRVSQQMGTDDYRTYHVKQILDVDAKSYTLKVA